MGLFDRKNKAINQLSNNPLQTLASGLKRMWAMAPKRDKMELVDLAHKSPRLDPIFIIARAVAGTEWNTYSRIDIKKNGKTAAPVFNEDIMSLLDYPIRRYPEIDWYALCYSTVAVVKAVGEYGWLKVRDERNKVIELNPIPPGWIMRTPTVGDPFYTIYPFGATAGVAIRVSPDDFIYFKRPDLNDPYGRGRGDSEQLEDEFEIDEYAGKAQKNLLYNDSTPPYIITAPGMPQDQAEAFKKSWMQKLGGYLHRREPGILGFQATVQPLGMSPLEMDMMESRKFIRDEIYMHYQLPPEIYGNIQNSNRATITSAEYLFHKNVLNTEYRFFERVITRQLIAVDFDKNLCFKFDDVVPDDEDFKLSVLNSGLTGGVVQVDEWRKAFDLPELPNGKGKVFLRTFAQYEVPADGKEPELPPDKPSGQTEDKPTDDALLSPEDLGLDAESAKSFKIVDYSTEKVSIVHKSDPKEERLTAIWKAFDSRATAKEGEFIQAVKKYAEDQKKRVVSAINNSKLEDTIKSGGAYNAEVESILGTVFDDKANKALKSALAPAWLHSLESGRDHTYDMVYGNFGKAVKVPKIRPSMTLLNATFNAWIDTNGLLHAEEINDTTNEALRKQLAQVISDGISNGDPVSVIKNALMDACENIYDNMSRARADNIAKTESTTTINFSVVETGKAEGMTMKQFLATKDERTREAHAIADGQTVPIGDPFIVDGEEMQYPGDQSASASNVCRCRCSMILGGDELRE